MISKAELEEYAKLRKLKNIGHAEKDYLQNVVLFIISQSYGKNFIFKGGTALNKCFGMDRFSEDLDFSCEKKVGLKHIENGLKRFKLEFETEKQEYENGVKLTIRIKGPLYIETRNSLCKVIVDMSLREKIFLKPEIKTIGRFLEEIPSFDILVMQKKEIFAEKIRAILTRNKARDLYDLWFIIKEGVTFDKKLIKEKLKYYQMNWNEKKFIKSVNEKESIWDSELKPLVSVVPSFKEVKEGILKTIF